MSEGDYERLAALREGIRRYLAWAEQCARSHDLTPAQVQLALAVRSHPDPEGPNLSWLSETLLLRHHSVVGLVNRAEEAGMVTRVADNQRSGGVRVRLTRSGSDRLESVSSEHLDWLAGHAADLAALLEGFVSSGD